MNDNKKEKPSFKEKLKDKRERAKIELILYGVFFLVVIIFVRFMSDGNTNIDNNNDVKNSDSSNFLDMIDNNYEYDMIITYGDSIYEYYGAILGNNGTVNIKDGNNIYSYFKSNNKYYVKENGEYILTSEDNIFSDVGQYYLDVKNIRQYLDMAIYNDGVYSVKVSDILLNNDSDSYVVISVNDGDNNVIIDYSELFRITTGKDINVIVNITYGNIGNVVSLDE